MSFPSSDLALDLYLGLGMGCNRHHLGILHDNPLVPDLVAVLHVPKLVCLFALPLLRVVGLGTGIH